MTAFEKGVMVLVGVTLAMIVGAVVLSFGFTPGGAR